MLTAQKMAFFLSVNIIGYILFPTVKIIFLVISGLYNLKIMQMITQLISQYSPLLFRQGNNFYYVYI